LRLSNYRIMVDHKETLIHSLNLSFFGVQEMNPACEGWEKFKDLKGGKAYVPTFPSNEVYVVFSIEDYKQMTSIQQNQLLTECYEIKNGQDYDILTFLL